MNKLGMIRSFDLFFPQQLMVWVRQTGQRRNYGL
jgi:hypothetical protein